MDGITSKGGDDSLHTAVEQMKATAGFSWQTPGFVLNGKGYWKILAILDNSALSATPDNPVCQP